MNDAEWEIGCLKAKVEKMRKALQMAKPVVGAAVAASSNESRPKRQRVYDKIAEALKL
jgi:hypothetical protein